MQRNAVIALTVVAVAAVAGAAYTVRVRDAGVIEQRRAESLFPGLMTRVNEVAALTFTTGEHAWSIARDEGGAWTVPEKDGYAASADKVKETVVALADATILEAKTAKPELYGKIGVDDVDKEGSEAVLVELMSGSGDRLATLLVGKTKSYQGGSAAAEVYVRRPGEARAWLVRARLDIAQDPTDWLEFETLKVTKERVSRVVTKHPDGEVITLERLVGDTETPIFKLQDVPEGHKVKSNFKVNAIAGALESLRFDDVARAEHKDFDGAAVTTFETDDGLRVTVRLLAEGEERWLQVRAAFDEALVAEDADAEGVEAEAEEIDARLGPWAYKVSGYKAEDFAHRMADLTEAVAPAEGDS